MKFLIPLVFSLLISCSVPGEHTVRLHFDQAHPWQADGDSPMWGRLVYYNGREIIERRIGSGTKSLTVEVLGGKTCVFVSYPLDSLRPAGAIYSPGSETDIHLSFDDGRLASLLLDAASYNAALIDSVSASALKKSLPADFDEDALYQALVSGSIGREKIPSAIRHAVTLSSMPEGFYQGEFDHGPFFTYSFGTEVCLELIAGLHRFWNRERGFVYVLALYPDGKTSYYSYSLTGW